MSWPGASLGPLLAVLLSRPGVPVTAVTAVTVTVSLLSLHHCCHCPWCSGFGGNQQDQSCRFALCPAACHFHPAGVKNEAVLGVVSFPKSAPCSASDQLSISCAWPHPGVCARLGARPFSKQPLLSSTRLVLFPLFPSGTDWHPVNVSGSSSVAVPPG